MLLLLTSLEVILFLNWVIFSLIASSMRWRPFKFVLLTIFNPVYKAIGNPLSWNCLTWTLLYFNVDHLIFHRNLQLLWLLSEYIVKFIENLIVLVDNTVNTSLGLIYYINDCSVVWEILIKDEMHIRDLNRSFHDYLMALNHWFYAVVLEVREHDYRLIINSETFLKKLQ